VQRRLCVTEAPFLEPDQTAVALRKRPIETEIDGLGEIRVRLQKTSVASFEHRATAAQIGVTWSRYDRLIESRERGVAVLVRARGER